MILQGHSTPTPATHHHHPPAKSPKPAHPTTPKPAHPQHHPASTPPAHHGRTHRTGKSTTHKSASRSEPNVYIGEGAWLPMARLGIMPAQHRSN